MRTYVKQHTYVRTYNIDNTKTDVRTYVHSYPYVHISEVYPWQHLSVFRIGIR